METGSGGPGLIDSLQVHETGESKSIEVHGAVVRVGGVGLRQERHEDPLGGEQNRESSVRARFQAQEVHALIVSVDETFFGEHGLCQLVDAMVELVFGNQEQTLLNSFLFELLTSRRYLVRVFGV